MSNRKRIGIIGGGASGVLTAIHCWRRLGDDVEILIFEPESELGRGRAYSTRDTEYLLNVPAQKMSAFGDQPDGFVNWLKANHPETERSQHWPFVPRIYFGTYLQDCLTEVPAQNLEHVREKVSGLSSDDRNYLVQLESGSTVSVQYLIVATGYQSELVSSYLGKLRRLKDHVLQPTEVESWSPGRHSTHVVVIGSGLTALDAWRRLDPFPGVRITFLSRRGLLPLPHAQSAEGVDLPTLSGMSPLQVFQVLRSTQRSGAIPWSAISDQVRIQAQKIWTCWTDREKSQFLRHLKPYWEVIRHRIPATISEETRTATSDGRLQVLSGRIQEIKEASNQIQVSYRDRRTSAVHTLNADWLVLATGSSIQQGLIQGHELSGLRRCPYGFGYINDSAPRLWIVGPASKATFWEITAVPDIREQARTVADAIATDETAQQIESPR